MIYGSKSDTEGQWFTLRGSKRRFLGRFPTVPEWEAYMTAGAALHVPQAKPLDAPARGDVVGFYRVARESVAALLTGIEIEGEARDIDENTWKDAVLNGGIYQRALADFAGWLFCDAAEFCDNGPVEGTGAAGV